MLEEIDSGPGIPPESQNQIFDRFFSSKKVGDVTGLGLDMVCRRVRNQRGEVTFKSRPGETRFIVKIPFTVSERNP